MQKNNTICYFHFTLFCRGDCFVVVIVLVLHQLARLLRGLYCDWLQPRHGGVVGDTGCDLVLGKC